MTGFINLTAQYTCPTDRPLKCFDGVCINEDYRCDGKLKCPDKSDEYGCGILIIDYYYA